MKRQVLLGSGVAFGALWVTGIVAYACIPIATLNLSQSTASPGSQVTASIHQISGADSPPVVFHWMSIDGPVLATVTPTDAGTTAALTIPSSTTQSGDYLVVATETQKSGYESWGMPARAVIHVDVSGSAAKAPAAAGTSAQTGPAGLANESGIGIGPLVLIAIATAAFGFLIVGGATVLAGRGSPKASTVSNE